MTRTVALVGGAESTRGGIINSKADEIWTINWSWKYEWIPRIDRLFEMHKLWLMLNDRPEYSKVKEHWEWLQQHTAYPVYMLKHVPSIPRCVEYPLQDIVADLYGTRLQKGMKPFAVFGSSFDYMMGMAIHEKWDVIEVYGMEMGSDTEYRYQRETAGVLIGMATARGIEVRIPDNSILLRTKLYGYEGGQMIFRQDLERMLQQHQKRHIDAMARLQHLEGQASTAMTNELQEKLQSVRDEALMASACEQLIRFQIRHIDLEEPEEEIINPIQKLEI